MFHRKIVLMPTETTNLDYYGKNKNNQHPSLDLIDGGEFRTGGHQEIVQRVVAGRDPLPTDDGSSTSSIGKKILVACIWINDVSLEKFICVENSVGVAQWDLLSGGGGGGSIDFYDEGTYLGTIDALRVRGDLAKATITGLEGQIHAPQNDTILKTKLNITTYIPSGTSLSVVSSGLGYIKSGNNGFLEISNALFLANNIIRIMPDGCEEEKGVEVVWINSSSFSLSTDLDAGDYIFIYS